LFDGQEVHIPNSPDSFDYDLFYSGSASPTTINKLPQPAMSIFRPPKPKLKAPRAPLKEKAGARALASKPSGSTPRLAAVPERDVGSADDDEALANLKNSLAKQQAEKRENAYVGNEHIEAEVLELTLLSSTIIDGPILTKGGKGMQAKSKLLGAQLNNAARSHPGSPAFAPVGSPLLAATGTPSQDLLKQHRYPIIHELAVCDHTFDELFKKYDAGTEGEFSTALNKVADFVDNSQKWSLKRAYWKDLDVQEYDYKSPEDRQKAIDNAIRQYDRMRIGVSDPVWQKLLPKAERNKGTCLSKLQAAIANKGSVPKISVSKTDASSVSGADSEKDDSTSSGAKKGKGGEPMSRSGSQTKKKLSASEAQAKRLLSNSKKPAPAAKASPKVSPTKSTAPAKATAASKNPRVKSKEFVSDSDSDEVPLSSSMPKPRSVAGPKPIDRVVEKPKVAERVKEPAVQKPKSTLAARPAPGEKERDTIRAQAPAAKAIRAPVKRQREVEEDDSSSSGAPLLSKRQKSGAKTQVAQVSNSLKQRTASDASHNSRATTSVNSLAKSKNTSPIKSSPLASSPPTNASELEHDRLATARDHGRGRDRERDMDRERDTIVSRAGSSTGSSTGGSVGGGYGGSSSSGIGKKRPVDDSSSPEGRLKRQRLSDEVINKANKFKAFYSRYEALHREISALRAPSEEAVADLQEMHLRLVDMKNEIYKDVEV
jgi:RNA polymerase II elongation factor ELL